MVPVLVDGRLPPGEWPATCDELVSAFGTTPWRLHLLDGCQRALAALQAARCRRVWIDGSFVTGKAHPGDGLLRPHRDGPRSLHPKGIVVIDLEVEVL